MANIKLTKNGWYVSVYVSGAPKTGKTTFLAAVQELLSGYDVAHYSESESVSVPKASKRKLKTKK